MISMKPSTSTSGSGRLNLLSGLLVYFTGSPRAGRWREAMAEVARERGWQVAEDDGSTTLAEHLVPDRPVLVLSSLTIPSHLTCGEFKTAVVKDTPGAAMQALASDGSRSAMIAAAYHGSATFAYAADMIRQGAVVLDASAPFLLLPLLGEVAAEQGVSSSTDTWRPLDIYSSLPPAVGVEAEWPLSAFSYPIMKPEGVLETGRSDIDLTGRARTIVYGPYIHLSPGLWEVEVESLIDPDGGMSHLRFEWGSNPDFVGSSVSVSRSGIYRIRLQRCWSGIGPSEMRVATVQPHFHGRFELLSVKVRLLSDIFPVETSLPD